MNGNFYTEQMDMEGLGCKLLLAPSSDPSRTSEKQTVGTVTTSHKMLTPQALSSSQNAGAEKRAAWVRRGFWVTSGTEKVSRE